MGDSRLPGSESSGDSRLVVVDPAALVEAILHQRFDRQGPNETESLHDDYDDMADAELKFNHTSNMVGRKIRPDSPPKDVNVGAVNPYALAEALLGRRIDRNCPSSAKILSNVLQTDYDELFDMKYNSVIYAGLKLNEKERKAEQLTKEQMKILKEQDLETPDFSEVRDLNDLKKLGLKDLGETRVKLARMQNGKLRLVLDAHNIGKKVGNRDVTMSINELVSPFRMQGGHWTPPNSSWRDMYDQIFQTVKNRVIGNLAMFQIGEYRNPAHSFDDPTQGCASDSYFVAALFSVFWSDPSVINRATRVHSSKEENKRLSVKFHDKGGHNNSRTETVEVNYELPINNSNNEAVYCRSSDGVDIWPSLYEKAFAKWITGTSSHNPDITQIFSGDPVKAMAQINGREPHYFQTEKHSAQDLMGLVRCNCLNFKTINPMTAWTYATGSMFKGSNLVANHAYSVLGYTTLGDKQYIILRNPWGVTEPSGLTSYPGVLDRVEPHAWHPAALLDHGGLFGMECQAFKHCFAYIGMAK